MLGDEGRSSAPGFLRRGWIVVRKRLFLVSLAIVMALAVAMTASADAAKGGGGATEPSINLVLPQTLAPVSGTWPALGQQVDFAVTYGNVKDPRVELLCYQNGVLVYGEARGATPDQGDYMGTNPFVLGGGMSTWYLNGGSATCTANLFYFGKTAGHQTYNVIASTKPFTAYGRQ